MSGSEGCSAKIGPVAAAARVADGAGPEALVKAAGWDTIPLFMSDLSGQLAAGERGTSSLEALQALIYDDDDEEKVRSIEALKARANELVGLRHHRQALGFYSQALDILFPPAPVPALHQNPPALVVSDQLRQSLFSNRAACHLALGNYRSCLTDCAAVLQPPQPTPATKLVRKCFFRSAKALVGLERHDEALDCLEKLAAIDGRDGVTEDPEPATLRAEIERLIALRERKKRDLLRAEERRMGVDQALRKALHTRGVAIPAGAWPPAAASLPAGFEPVHFEELPEELAGPELEKAAAQSALVYPVYVLRPKEVCPTRDLVLRWHEDDTMAVHLETLCGDTHSHRFYLISTRKKILKCGNNLSLRRIAASVAKGNPPDSLSLGHEGHIDLFLLPVGQPELDWIAQTKNSLAHA